MIKLKNVSKFYYSKGLVSSGITKVNLSFELGEFVAITGESGGGKSTLLNVISGLDTYEEGEMYIEGEETSHYTEKDREEYRKKYIGNIFQTFNLVNSYTVYQNIELVLLINGYKKKEVKSKILDIIKEVELTRYKNTKVSKLSGGQKQRVAIARALAKDTPIIIADEPTGNLDSRSAESVLKILSKVSQNKLVVIVTHNYEQIEPYATRRVKMHDGRVLEDKALKSHEKPEKVSTSIYKDISGFNKLRLGIRNTFNVIPKFLLLLLVYLFITASVTAEYSTLKKQEYENSKMGYNMYFNNISDKRIVIQKNDLTAFLESDYESIASLDNIDYIVKDDLTLDNKVSISSNYFYFAASAVSYEKLGTHVDKGRLPETDYEIVIEGDKDNYYLSEELESLLNSEFDLQNNNTGMNILEYKIKVVGIRYIEEEIAYDDAKFYVSDTVLNDIRINTNESYSSVTSTLNDHTLKSLEYSNMYKIRPSSKVPSGNVVISEDLNYLCKKFNCKRGSLNVNVENIYYTEDVNLYIENTYNKKTYKKYTGYDDYDMNNGAFYMNKDDYYNLFNKSTYQSSVFIKDTTKSKDTINDLQELGLKTLYIKEAIVNPYGQALVFTNLIIAVFLTVVTIALFFISYFIIKIILKSRNIYFSTIRILGASKKTANELLNIELFTVFNFAFFTIMALLYMISKNIIASSYIANLIKYLSIKDYIVLYVILFIISLLITRRYAKKLFTSSAMNTYREEV